MVSGTTAFSVSMATAERLVMGVSADTSEPTGTPFKERLTIGGHPASYLECVDVKDQSNRRANSAVALNPFVSRSVRGSHRPVLP